MKLNKIKSLCKAAKRCILFNELGDGGELRRQWMGTGSGIYLLEGLPMLGTANIPPLLGLEGNAVEKVKITLENLPTGIDTSDYDASETALVPLPAMVSVGGADLVLYKSAYQVWALDAGELAPAINSNCTVKMRWKADGTPYFVIFRGMFLEAILLRERSGLLDNASRNGLGLWLDWMKDANTNDAE